MRLNDFGKQIAECEDAVILTAISQQIRRCAWNGHAQQAAYKLARIADEKAVHISGGNTNPAPRWDALVSNGILHEPIR